MVVSTAAFCERSALDLKSNRYEKNATATFYSEYDDRTHERDADMIDFFQLSNQSTTEYVESLMNNLQKCDRSCDDCSLESISKENYLNPSTIVFFHNCDWEWTLLLTIRPALWTNWQNCNSVCAIPVHFVPKMNRITDMRTIDAEWIMSVISILTCLQLIIIARTGHTFDPSVLTRQYFISSHRRRTFDFLIICDLLSEWTI